MLTKKLALVGIGVLAGIQVAAADVVTDWNATLLDTVRARGTPPPVAARNLAITHVAMFDAVNGIHNTHKHYLVRPAASRQASPEAAASAAAHAVLSTLYPLDIASFDALHSDILLAIADGPAKDAGLAWGAEVAAALVAARAGDGASLSAPWPGSEAPGQWRPTVSFGGIVRPALLPMWGYVAPFAIQDVGRMRPPAPPELNTRRYAAELNYVKQYGSVDSVARTADQTEIAHFWAYGPGTATPPGHWNEIALTVAESEGNTLAENARVFALLNIALADAAIVSWDAKYAYNYWRPITAIQLADTDGNAATEPDTGWAPLLETPPFPEYTSGHSTFSGAAAVTLAFFYGRDDIAFTVGSDDLPGVYRSYGGFWQAAQESGASRIFGGIHFQSANVHGLNSGAATARYVVRHYLAPKRRS